MTFVKALCVLLLLYYASFGESERLENDSISKKAQQPDEEQKKVERISPYDKKMNAYKLGEQLANTVRFVTGKEQGKLISFSHQRNRDMACRSGQKHLFAIYGLYRDANMSC